MERPAFQKMQKGNNHKCICDSIKQSSWYLQIQEFFTEIPSHCICSNKQQNNTNLDSKKNQAGQKQEEMYFPEVFPQRNSGQEQIIDQQKYQDLLQEQNGENCIPVDSAQNHRKNKNKKIKKEKQKDASKKQRDNVKNAICSSILKIDSLKIPNYQQFVQNKLRDYEWDQNLYRNQKFMCKISLDFRKQKLQKNLDLQEIKNWINQKSNQLKNQYKNSRYFYKISNCLQNGFLKIIQAYDFDIALQGIMNIYSTKTKKNSAYVCHSSQQGIRQVYDLLAKEKNINEYQLQRYKEYMIEKECWIDQQLKNKIQN